MQKSGSRFESPDAPSPAIGRLGSSEVGDKLRMGWGANVHNAPFLPYVENHPHSGYSPSSACPAAYEFYKTMISIQKDRLSTAQPSFY